MVPLFYDNYLIFNTNVNIINKNKVTVDIKDIENATTDIKKSNLIKILQSEIEDYIEVDYLTILLAFFLLHAHFLLYSEDKRKILIQKKLITYIKSDKQKNNDNNLKFIQEKYSKFDDYKIIYKKIHKI